MKRYERQIAIAEIGISGQQKLTASKVLIIGVGGLGCPVLQNLAAAGVGTIGIVDGDFVEETNLHRQFLYGSNDLGRSKVEVAAEVVSKQNPGVRIVCYPDYFSRQNCLEIASDYQVIVDCSDTIATRYLINDVSVQKGIPMVYASIHKFEGQLSVFNYKNGPTYRCLFPEDNRLEAIPDCNDSGVLGVMPNLLGTMQSNEALKIILEIGEVLSGKLMLYNSLSNDFQIIEIQINKNLKKEIIFDKKPKSIWDFLSDDDCLFIDIRENYEDPKLDLQNIKNVPLSQLEAFLNDFDKDQKIVLICQNGSRSELAVDYLVKNGFENVFHLQNGIEALNKMNSYDNR